MGKSRWIMETTALLAENHIYLIMGSASCHGKVFLLGEGVGKGVLWICSASGCQCRLLQQLPRGSQNILFKSQAGNSSQLVPFKSF